MASGIYKETEIMFSKLKEVEARYLELEKLLSDPGIVTRQSLYQKYAKEHADLRDLVEAFREYEKIVAGIEEGQQLLRGDDEELKEIDREELPELRQQLTVLEDKLKVLLLPRDPNDDRNVFLETPS